MKRRVLLGATASAAWPLRQTRAVGNAPCTMSCAARRDSRAPSLARRARPGRAQVALALAVQTGKRLVPECEVVGRADRQASRSSTIPIAPVKFEAILLGDVQEL